PAVAPVKARASGADAAALLAKVKRTWPAGTAEAAPRARDAAKVLAPVPDAAKVSAPAADHAAPAPVHGKLSVHGTEG
ncbi:MAG TPA: 2-oxoglutarate dehydrogenase, E2 component, dihydrolipoamide succinyltransferase, partial [Candidatus Hydrogenedentes bacterium]|nr:2-oxoglutarate dehydrogenase, E2 component, dihydrolipoamide succinyltransferase [Candidatus Hydrogenedentota bacterium]